MEIQKDPSVQKEDYERQCLQSLWLILYSIVLLKNDADLNKILRQLAKFTETARKHNPLFQITREETYDDNGRPKERTLVNELHSLVKEGLIEKSYDAGPESLWRITRRGKTILHYNREHVPRGIKVKEGLF